MPRPAVPHAPGPFCAGALVALAHRLTRGRQRPRSRPAHGRAAPGAGQRGDAGQLHRLRLRPVPGPEPDGDGPLAPELAVPGGRHLHLRRLARLPLPTEPDATWVRTQLASGWRLLPITLGPQASCQPRFPRYGDDPRSAPSPAPASTYAKALQQGRTEARTSVAAAQALGISPGSTLWYDLEGFDSPTPAAASRRCRSSAAGPSRSAARLHVRRLLQRRLRDQGARRRPGQPARALPPARPDLDRPLGRRGQHQHVVHPLRRLAPARPGQAVPGRARRDLGRRHHQHRPQLPRPRPRLGRGAPRPTAAASSVDFSTYDTIRAPRSSNEPKPPASRVKALQCLLKEQGFLPGQVNGNYGTPTIRAVRTVAGRTRSSRSGDAWSRRNWMIAAHRGSATRC